MPCVSIAAKQKRKRYLEEYWSRPENIRRAQSNDLRRLYGITYDDKVQMYRDQMGLCGLCGKQLLPEVSAAHVDHDHETGKVRKLVHKQCNSLIAYFERDPQLFYKIIEYLRD